MSTAWLILLSVYALYAIFLVFYILNLFKRMSFLNDDKIKFNDDLPGFTRKDFSKWSRFHFYVGALILLPIRSLMIFPTILFTYIILKVLSLLFCTFNYKGKLNPCFKFLCTLVVTCACRFILFASGFYWISYNRKTPQAINSLYFENLGEVKHANIICNHTSWIDIFFFLSQPKSVGFISNKQVKDYFLIGTIAQIIQCVFVDRKNSESRKKCFVDLKNRTKNIKSSPKGSVFFKQYEFYLINKFIMY